MCVCHHQKIAKKIITWLDRNANLNDEERNGKIIKLLTGNIIIIIIIIANFAEDIKLFQK
jgi:hypothetical protein